MSLATIPKIELFCWIDCMKNTLQVNTSQVQAWLKTHHRINGELTSLVGDVDCNFKCQAEHSTYTVKISRVINTDGFDFETALLTHLQQKTTPDSALNLPMPVLDNQGNWLTLVDELDGDLLVMRLLSWVDGALWSEFKPHRSPLLQHLGRQAARLDVLLQDFEHPLSTPELAWDLAQALWIKDHLGRFDEAQQATIQHFIGLYQQHQNSYQQLRTQVIHNDLNDNNIVVDTRDVYCPKVSGFIDFGDAIKTQLINEVAILCAYAIMHQPDPLKAACDVVRGFHETLPLQAAELQLLYPLIGMRLAVSVTQASLARANAPANDYKTISEQPAWEALHRWQPLDPAWVLCHFRAACDMTPHPEAIALQAHLKKQAVSLGTLLPEQDLEDGVKAIDLGVGSTLLGNAAEYEAHALQLFKMHQMQAQHPKQLLAGGYGEARSFYAADAFSIEGNDGKAYRTVHLGLDVWLPAQTPIHAPLAGVVYVLHDNDRQRDYGPTLILQHEYQRADKATGHFYTLYGHLSRATLQQHQVGDAIAVGQLLGWTGEPHENGGWSPHLHLQVMHDLLGFTDDFPGACTPNDWPVMHALCPDPASLFTDCQLPSQSAAPNQPLIEFRQQHLGKSLSLSYDEPLQILRGDDVYLLDQWGQKYLDTCNNVAHVGHEHPRVVAAGQAQMAVLNTNSRYLHPTLQAFSEALLATLPEELSVLHLVNSGSEANELALRMAQAYTGSNHVIALESGYHGNSAACIDISSYKFDGRGGAGAPAHTHIVPLPDAFRGRHSGTTCEAHGGADCATAYAQYVQDVVDELAANNQPLSAFIAESIVSCGGQIELPAGYLKQVYAMVKKAGGLCIADEVQVGCGRIGTHFWAFAAHDVVPDILTIGKPIGNGHPLAVVACTREVAERFANGMEYFNTFGGNPVSATIGQAVLSVIKDEGLQQNALHTGHYLKQHLQRLQSQFPIIKDVRGQGLFLGFELCDDDLNPLPKQAAYLANRMRELGILISTDGPDHNVIKLKPPMTFRRSHADELLNRLSTVLGEYAMRN